MRKEKPIREIDSLRFKLIREIDNAFEKYGQDFGNWPHGELYGLYVIWKLLNTEPLLTAMKRIKDS